MAANYSSNKLILKAMMIAVGCNLVEILKNRFKGAKVPKYVMINNWIDKKEVYLLP